MRIDYSEPKKSYTAPQNLKQKRKEPLFGGVVLLLIAAVAVAFLAGFGSGWFFSQRSAKKAFKAATEQAGLEASAKQPDVPSKPVQQPENSTPPRPENKDGSSANTPPPLSGSHPDPYNTLPKGERNNAIGSGINSRDDKPKDKELLQAVIPANVARPQPVAEAALPVKERILHSADKSAKGGNFTVQIASYSLKSEAETTRSKFSGKGYSAYIVESNQGEKGIWYRVRVGRKLEQDAAKELAGKLGKGAIAIQDKD